MKRIFIGSADFSGSTMLDMMIGNGDRCFALGEAYALFEKDNIGCSCGAGNNCPIWKPIKKMGFWPSRTYLRRQLKSSVLSDSSKIESWIKKHFTFYDHVILIYKHPLNYLFSCYKRGHRSVFQILFRLWRWWIYYPKMLKMFPKAIVVSYRDLAQYPAQTLEKLCSLIDVEYFTGKEYFWEKQNHHVLYGSGSARTHLYDTDSELFKSRSGDETKFHRSFYYSEAWKEKKWYHYLGFLVEPTYRQLEKRRISIC